MAKIKLEFSPFPVSLVLARATGRTGGGESWAKGVGVLCG